MSSKAHEIVGTLVQLGLMKADGHGGVEPAGAQLSVDGNGNTVVVGADGDVVYKRVKSIGVYQASLDGGTTAQVVANEVVVTPAMNGTKIVFTAVLKSDFTETLLLPDGGILFPEWATEYWAFGSIGWTAAANGIRWARLIHEDVGGDLIQHAANFANNTVGTIAPTVTQVTTGGWAAVQGPNSTPGERNKISLHGVQNSGGSITLNKGTVANLGSSTYLRVHFR